MTAFAAALGSRAEGWLARFQVLSPVRKAYVLGATLIGLWAVLALPAGPIVSGVGYAGLVMLAACLVFESYKHTVRALTWPLGKVVAAVVMTMAAALAAGISSDVINNVTGVEPSKFPYTVAFLTPLAATYLLVIAVVVLSILAATVGVMAAVLHYGWVSALDHFRDGKDQANQIAFFHALRLVALIALAGFVQGAWQKRGGEFDVEVEDVARWFIFHFETYPKGACKTLPGERFRSLDNGMMVVAQEHGGRIRFSTRECRF